MCVDLALKSNSLNVSVVKKKEDRNKNSTICRTNISGSASLAEAVCSEVLCFCLFVCFRQHITMGIHGLAKLIADQAPGAIKEQDIKNYFGR